MSTLPGRPHVVVRVLVAIAAVLVVRAAFAGPVLVYRQDGWCPHDRPADAPRISAEQAIERARALLPKEFCGPDWYVDGWLDGVLAGTARLKPGTNPCPA